MQWLATYLLESRKVEGGCKKVCVENAHFYLGNTTRIKIQLRVKFGPFGRRRLIGRGLPVIGKNGYSQTVINGLFVWPTRRLALIPNIKLFHLLQ